MPAVLAPLADVSIVVVAIVAIMMIYAVVLIADIISWILHHAPDIWPINQLYHVSDWVVSVLTGVATWLWSIANPFHLIPATWTWIADNIWNPAVNFAQSMGLAMQRFVTHTIPVAIGAALGTVQQWIAQAASVAAGAVTNIYNLAWQWVNHAELVAAADTAAAVSLLTGEIKGVLRTVSVDIAAADAAVIGIMHDLLRPVEAEIKVIKDAIPAAIATAEAATLPRIQSLEDLAKLLIVPTLAGVIAEAGAVATDWAQWKKGCGNNLCSNLGNLATDFQNLLGVMDDGLLFLLVTELINDPKGVADAVREVIVQPAQDITDALRAA